MHAYMPEADESDIQSAYDFAREAHEGQSRLSGDPYIVHCLEVAHILTKMRLDSTTIAAGILHDVIEDTGKSVEELKETFGSEIASLVEGVTKLASFGAKTSAERVTANLRKMLVAMAADIRVILIKLADRIHNMETLEYLSEAKIRRISNETLEIYAPLAQRLGMAQVKGELEDLAFRFLHPDVYYDLAKRVAKKRKERHALTEEICAKLQHQLLQAGVESTVQGRSKHLYSIYEKMNQQGKDFDEIYDLMAMRVITNTVRDCYAALGLVHNMWKPVLGRFKDYIALPKLNIYQSLHTTMIRENGEPLEIQIRTHEMHRTAEFGVAAHWRYKDSDTKDDPKFEKRVNWMRQMLEWLQDLKDPQEFVESLKVNLFSGDTYVFTPKGDLKELPEGSTPIDFAYAIHTDIGNHCFGARVNGKLVPLRYHLQPGDVVEIITSEKQLPTQDWLRIVKTAKARTKIRQALRARQDDPTYSSKLEKEDGVPASRKVAIRHSRPVPKERSARLEEQVWVQGQNGIELRFAQCCHPQPGDTIIGYVTKNRGVSIHRGGCGSLAAHRDTARFLEVAWKGDPRSVQRVGIRVTADDRPNLLIDILRSFHEQNLNITSAQASVGKHGLALCDLVLELMEEQQLPQVTAAISQVMGVRKVQEIGSIKGKRSKREGSASEKKADPIRLAATAR